MDAAAKEAFIREVARGATAGRGGILWSRHAIERLSMAALSRSAVEAALVSCELIEDYPPVHRPLPDCLVLAKLTGGEPIHAVIALDVANGRLFMVTVYRPDPVRWLDERTRRSR